MTGVWTASYEFKIIIRPVPKKVPGGSYGKQSACNAGDLHSVPGLGGSPGEGNGYSPPPVFLPGKSHGQRNLEGYIVYGVS